VLFAAKQVSLSNSVVRSELGVRCRIVFFATKQVSLPDSIVHGESGVRCRIVLSAAKQVFDVELCCPQ
jgi:hypothetical protein